MLFIYFFKIFVTCLWLNFDFTNCHPTKSTILKDELITVQIEDGIIGGRKVETKFNHFFAFQEIPYASPPLGDLRFKEPRSPQKWEGVLNTTSNTKICVSFENYEDPRQNEDCLYLNVYTPLNPQNTENETLPVLFWIHGGSFKSGSGTYEAFGPNFFMNYGIILVTINYRLGPLGFLTTEDNAIPGNLGLRDQNLALKWVQRNIQVFGGNPEQVTIIGQSAGSACVGYQILSEQSKGLFKAAIMESGSPLSCWSLQKYAKKTAYLYGEAISSTFSSKNSSQELLTLLQNAPIDDLTKADITLPPEESNCYGYLSMLWTPVIENENLTNVFIKGLTHESIKQGKFNQVPLLIGFNSQEILSWDLRLLPFVALIFDANPAFIINSNLRMPNDSKPKAGVLLKQLYTNKTFFSDISATVKVTSDNLFTTSIARHSYLHSQYSDVYLYQFSYEGKMGETAVTKSFIAGAEGVGHSEELGYLFENKQNADLSKFPASDLIIQDSLLQLWTGFAKTNNPTSNMGTLSWPKVTAENFYYLDINSTISVKKGPMKYEGCSKIIDQYSYPILDTY